MKRLMAIAAACAGLLLGLQTAHTRADAPGGDTGAGVSTSASAGPERTYTLIRVAPISGTNPFDSQSLRDDVTAVTRPPAPGGSCKVGPLLLTSALPLIPAGSAYVDVDASAGTLRIRDGGGATANTALVVSLPAIDTTRVAIGSAGWKAVSPGLPRTYNPGVPPQTFVVRRTASGDAYRLTLGFLGTSTLRIGTASGRCCGTGSCP